MRRAIAIAAKQPGAKRAKYVWFRDAGRSGPDNALLFMQNMQLFCTGFKAETHLFPCSKSSDPLHLQIFERSAGNVLPERKVRTNHKQWVASSLDWRVTVPGVEPLRSNFQRLLLLLLRRKCTECVGTKCRDCVTCKFANEFHFGSSDNWGLRAEVPCDDQLRAHTARSQNCAGIAH